MEGGNTFPQVSGDCGAVGPSSMCQIKLRLLRHPAAWGLDVQLLHYIHVKNYASLRFAHECLGSVILLVLVLVSSGPEAPSLNFAHRLYSS